MKSMNASWVMDYDYTSDRAFYRPGCPACKEPVGMNDDGKYRCFSCGQEVNVDDHKMIDWFRKRSGEKVEREDCFQCGGKGTVETHMVRNKVNLNWQAAWGECKECGMRFIV